MKKRTFALALALLIALLPCAGAYGTGSVSAYTTLSLGDDYTAAIKADGSLWTWGRNSRGRLGDGTNKNHDTPVKILDDVVSVDIRNSYSVAIKSDGSLWAWGSIPLMSSNCGIEGNAHDSKTGSPYQTVPVKMMDDVAAVSAGSSCIFTIKPDGSLWFWGYNSNGLAGNGSSGETFAKSIKIMDGVASVSMGSSHVAVVKSDGSLWTWGSNFYGELGNNSRGNERTQYGYLFQTRPVKIMDDVIFVNAGNDSTAAIKSDGSLWTWGQNNYGVLGNGGVGNTLSKDEKPYQTIPTKILDDVVSVNMGDYHAAAIRSDGSLWTWGQNNRGALGNGNRKNWCELLPIKVMDDVVTASVGYSHTAAIKSDGSLWIWGSNRSGQLGNDGVGNTETFVNNYHNPEHAPKNPNSDTYQDVPYCLPDFRAALPSPAEPAESTDSVVPTALPSPCAATLNGESVTLNAYLFPDNGGGSNYVMLRDVAYLLNGTGARFEVGWEKDRGILLSLGQSYTPIGQELQIKSDGPKPYAANESSITVDGMPITLEGYTIEGNNYFKLRDLGRVLGFEVGWNGSTGAVTIRTDKK